jgi:hypothetical protein
MGLGSDVRDDAPTTHDPPGWHVYRLRWRVLGRLHHKSTKEQVMTLPLPFAFQDREPVILKLGPAIDFAALKAKEDAEKQAQAISEDTQRQYDPWFTLPPFVKNQRVWVWRVCSHQIHGRTRVRNEQHEYPYAAYVEEVDSERQTCKLVLSNSIIPDIPWADIMKENPHPKVGTLKTESDEGDDAEDTSFALKEKKKKAAVKCTPKVRKMWICPHCDGTRMTCVCDDDD